ncbi:MAG: hypothetical protein R3E08_01065 [Thiotrichaceae bacterium]
MSDLDIIAQLEQLTGKKLKKLDEIKSYSVGYQLNAQQRVIGLSLYKCELKEFPREICQLQQLQTLGLWRNQLTELPEEIGQLRELKTVHLGENQLTELPEEISQLRELQTLNLHHNQFTQFPKELPQQYLAVEWDKVWNEEGIHVEGNPFEIPPVEIVKQGRRAIIDYFNALESQQDRPCAGKMSGDLDTIAQIGKRIERG